MSSPSTIDFEEKLAKDDGHLDITIWFDYVKFLVQKQQQQAADFISVNTVFERALRIPAHSQTSVKLWNMYLRERIKQQQQSSSSSSPSSSVKSVHNLFLRAINTLQQQNGKKQETPLLSLFTAFFDFLVLCHREQQAPLLIISTVKLSQQHLHPFALATLLQHVLATTSTKSNLLAIAVEVLTWILKTQQHHHRHNRQNKVSNLDKFLLPKIPLLTLYKFVRATLENFVDCGENNNQNDIGIEKNPFFVALVASLECLDLLTLLIAKGQMGDEDSSHNQREVLVSQLLLSSSQSNNQVIPYRRFVEDCLVPIMNHAMDNLNVNAPSPLIQKVCYRFVTNIIWSLKQSGNNNNNSNNNTTQTQAVADDEYNESSSLFCSSIVAAASCLSRNCCQDSSSSSSSLPSVDYASAARHLIKSSLPHCSNDDEVQTLYICLLALNRESSLVTQQKTSKKNDDNEEDAIAEGDEGDDENYGTDLSLDGLQREIVTRRTTRDPTNPANWLELIAIATEQQQQQQQDTNRGNRHEDDANDDNVITINDELFQRAISACTQEAALALEAQKRRNTSNNNNTNSRPVHLFLAYAAWLEQKFVAERHSRQQEQYSSDFGNNQDHLYLRSSSLSGSRNEPRYAKSAVELLKRAVIASSSSSNNKDSTLSFPIIYAFSDRSLLLQAAAECILRTYQTYRIASTNNDSQEEGILECISFLAEVCGDSNNNKSGEKAQSPLLPHGEYSAPLWAMRVELLLAIDRTDEAVQVCWRGMLSQANNNPASSNTNNISSKLLLIVADSLVARGIEIAENDIIMKQIIATSTAGIDNNNNEDGSGTGGGNVQMINASFSNDTSLNPSQDTSYSHFINNNNNYSQQQQQQLTNEDSSNNLMVPSSSILLCSQNNNYDYSLRSFSQAQQEGFVAIAANEAIDDETNEYYPLTTSTTKIKSSSNSLPSRSLHLFEQASRLVHTYLDILSKNPITSSKTSPSSSSLFTMYAVSFHLTLFLAPLLVHQDSKNNKNISRNLNQDSASSSSLIAPDYSYSLEMIRQLHKNTLNSLLLAQRDYPSNTTVDVQKSLCWFALGMLEWDSGLNSNAIEAFMKFSEIEIKYANNKENSNAENSNNNETSATERGEVHDVNGDDSSSLPSPSYAAFAFTLRHAAKVLLSNIMVTSQRGNDNSDSSSSTSDGGNSSSSSSNAANVALFINLAETLMQQTPSVKELLKFGMQMLMYLFAIAPSANGNKNTVTSATSGSIDSIIKNCLRSLAEYEDPIEDDCGVWKAWKDYVLRTNDLNGFNDMTRLRRDLVREKERRKEETIVV